MPRIQRHRPLANYRADNLPFLHQIRTNLAPLPDILVDAFLPRLLVCHFDLLLAAPIQMEPPLNVLFILKNRIVNSARRVMHRSMWQANSIHDEINCTKREQNNYAVDYFFNIFTGVFLV